MTRPATLLAVVAALVVAAVLAVLLTRPDQARVQPVGGRGQAQSQPVADVRVARTRLGRILVDRRGHTLYLFLSDRRGRSVCNGGCARVWPPAIVSGAPRAGPGVAAAKLRTTRRRDGSRQLVYHGHPLYGMAADTRPGETEGQGFLGTWYAVSPAGRMVGRRRAGAGGYG